jgi:xanthine dehydrogenase large subunit
MVIACSSQHPTEIQHKVAEALGVPMHAVRVEVRRMGGGFGGKESQGNHLAVACALAARATGRPCKMRYDRDDDFLITGKRHDFRIDYRVGFDDAGRILGIDFRHYTRCGWAMDLSLPVADRAMLHADNAYFLPAVRIESHRLRTNTQSATAFRGFGGPQGMLGIERVMDHIAHRLAATRWRCGGRISTRRPTARHRRRRRCPRRRCRPPTRLSRGGGGGRPRRARTARGRRADHALPDAGDRFHPARACRGVARIQPVTPSAAQIAAWNDTNPILKRGIALTPVKFGISFTLTHLNQAGALVHVYQDGSIHLNHGGTEMGQGLFQKVAQVAAHAFGVPLSRVRITATDTAKVPNTSATAASSGSDLNGMAVRAACLTIRDRIAAMLAEEHQCRPEEVRFADDRVRWRARTTASPR